MVNFGTIRLNSSFYARYQSMPLLSQIREFLYNSLLGEEASVHVSHFIATGNISFLEAISLTENERANLESAAVRGFIGEGNDATITFEQALELTEFQRDLLECDDMAGLINGNIMTIEQVINLTEEHLHLLLSGHIGHLLQQGVLGPEQILGADPEQVGILLPETIRDLINDETITLRQALWLDRHQQFKLENWGVGQLLRAGIITLERAVALSSVQAISLSNAEAVQRLIARELTIDDFLNIAVPRPNPPQDPLLGRGEINYSQSAHNAGVHQSASASATRLLQRYGSRIAGSGLEQTLTSLEQRLSALDDSRVNKAAKDCLERLVRLGNNGLGYTEQPSGVTNVQLLALAYLAVLDETVRPPTVSAEEAFAELVQTLYEIQRGGNLDDADQDNGLEDGAICAQGTFNKLVQGLAGIHPDCTICFITSTTAAMKLPTVVREAAMDYVAQRANPRSEAEFTAFTRLIEAIKRDGLEVVYSEIKDDITTRMLDEFGILYSGDDDPALTALVDAGEYVELKLDELNHFQPSIQASEGYRQYCSRTLQSSARGLFFSSTATGQQERLSAARHDSPEAQEAYDQQYGLVPR